MEIRPSKTVLSREQLQKPPASFGTADALSPLTCGMEMDPDSDVVMKWGITARRILDPFLQTRN